MIMIDFGDIEAVNSWLHYKSVLGDRAQKTSFHDVPGWFFW